MFKPSPHRWAWTPEGAAIWTAHHRHIFAKSSRKSRVCFFLQVWTLCWRSMYWIKSLSAQPYPDHWLPSNSDSQKAIPEVFVRVKHNSGRLKGSNVSILNYCKSVALTQCTCWGTQLLINVPWVFTTRNLLFVVSSMMHLNWMSHLIWWHGIKVSSYNSTRQILLHWT